MTSDRKIAVIIVSFRNPADVGSCLHALENCIQTYPFEVFICENGGVAAASKTLDLLRESDYDVSETYVVDDTKRSNFARVTKLSAKGGRLQATFAEANDNLGYAGGINAWIRALPNKDDWRGYWILNPDTFAEPDALAELVSYSEKYSKGMVGSRLMSPSAPNRVQTRGLSWSHYKGQTIGVDKLASALQRPDREDVERRIDSPSGASFYLSRECLERIGLMDESYFLYFEDFDWGLHAKAACGVGYAFDSVVTHVGGTTIGSASNRRERSQLAVYLDFRNRLLFVRRNYPGWYLWTVAIVLARTGEYLAVGSFRNFRAALAGWWAGFRGETGRPDRLLKQLAG